MGPNALIGLYIDIQPGAGLAGIEVLRVYQTPENRIYVESTGEGDGLLSAILIDATAENIDLMQQVADAMRAMRSAA